MEKYADMKLTIDESGIVPSNVAAKQFHAMLPDEYKLHIKFNEDLSEYSVELPGDLASSVDFDSWLFLKNESRDALKRKSNIPEELIDQFYSQKENTVEELAYSLRFYLDYVRQTEDTGAGPNVTNSLTRSELSFVAHDMLGRVLEENYPMLHDFVAELLNVDRKYSKIIKNNAPVKRNECYRLRVIYPSHSLRDIAKFLGVNVSTVSLWLKDAEAEEKLEEARHCAVCISRAAEAHPELSVKDLAAHLQVAQEHVVEKLKGMENLRDFMKSHREKETRRSN